MPASIQPQTVVVLPTDSGSCTFGLETMALGDGGNLLCVHRIGEVRVYDTASLGLVRTITLPVKHDELGGSAAVGR